MGTVDLIVLLQGIGLNSGRTNRQQGACLGYDAILKVWVAHERGALHRTAALVVIHASPPDKFAIDIMLAAMAGAIRSLLESEPAATTVRKWREQLVLLGQSYMAAAS
jgi:hypothetical protein